VPLGSPAPPLPPVAPQRFTLAHEFAHVVLHSRRRVSEPDQRQREADYFAGALLLPRRCAQEAIAESLTLGGYMPIKAKFGISLHAIVTRARRLGLITRDRQRSRIVATDRPAACRSRN
jgi:Zn-dependent peptidase ImmA (M78 family)